MGDMELKVLKERENHYEVEDPDGNKMTMYKIDMDSIKKSHEESIIKVATAIEGSDLFDLFNVFTNVLNNIPSVTEYLDIAENLSAYLKVIYEKVGSPNIFWHPIKNIDPDIYGKAQTLIPEVFDLFKICGEVAKEMEKMDKIKDFQFETGMDIMDFDLYRKTTGIPPYKEIKFSFVK
jgi:hypothetical protein